MKHLSALVLLLYSLSVFTQEQEKTHGLFYKVSVAATLTTNENYTISNDNDDTFINPNGLFLNNTIGYQFDSRSSIGLNLEYNHFLDQNLNFFPVYLDFTYNIFDFDDVVFVRGGYGTIVDLGKSFEDGNMYKLGVGYRHFDDNFKNSWLIGFDFSRRRFGFRQTEKLSSFAIFMEFMLF
jgi:hypothetical protein